MPMSSPQMTTMLGRSAGIGSPSSYCDGRHVPGAASISRPRRLAQVGDWHRWLRHFYHRAETSQLDHPQAALTSVRVFVGLSFYEGAFTAVDANTAELRAFTLEPPSPENAEPMLDRVRFPSYMRYVAPWSTRHASGSTRSAGPATFSPRTRPIPGLVPPRSSSTLTSYPRRSRMVSAQPRYAPDLPLVRPEDDGHRRNPCARRRCRYCVPTAAGPTTVPDAVSERCCGDAESPRRGSESDEIDTGRPYRIKSGGGEVVLFVVDGRGMEQLVG